MDGAEVDLQFGQNVVDNDGSEVGLQEGQEVLAD